jgi:hypothetical protein
MISSPSDVGGRLELKSGTAPSNASDNPPDADGDGYTYVEEYLNGTEPTEFVDYIKPENNINISLYTGRNCTGTPSPVKVKQTIKTYSGNCGVRD